MNYKKAKKLYNVMEFIDLGLDFTKIGIWVYILIEVIKIYNKVG